MKNRKYKKLKTGFLPTGNFVKSQEISLKEILDWVKENNLDKNSTNIRINTQNTAYPESTLTISGKKIV